MSRTGFWASNFRRLLRGWVVAIGEHSAKKIISGTGHSSSSSDSSSGYEGM